VFEPWERSTNASVSTHLLVVLALATCFILALRSPSFSVFLASLMQPDGLEVDGGQYKVGLLPPHVCEFSIHHRLSLPLPSTYFLVFSCLLCLSLVYCSVWHRRPILRYRSNTQPICSDVLDARRWLFVLRYSNIIRITPGHYDLRPTTRHICHTSPHYQSCHGNLEHPCRAQVRQRPCLIRHQRLLPRNVMLLSGAQPTMRSSCMPASLV